MTKCGENFKQIIFKNFNKQSGTSEMEERISQELSHIPIKDFFLLGIIHSEDWKELLGEEEEYLGYDSSYYDQRGIEFPYHHFARTNTPNG